MSAFLNPAFVILLDPDPKMIENPILIRNSVLMGETPKGVIKKIRNASGRFSQQISKNLAIHNIAREKMDLEPIHYCDLDWAVETTTYTKINPALLSGKA